jgi:sulfhydrogenase subunit beta (sulfur reductase)
MTLSSESQMTRGMLSRDDLLEALQAWMQRWRVIAPVLREREARFEEVEDAASVALDYGNAKHSLKSVYLPQVEQLLTYMRRRDDHNVITVSDPPTGPTMLFGVRPCDARARLMVDRVMVDGVCRDRYYAERRDGIVVVGLACEAPRSTCFCGAFDSGPYDPTGTDLFLRVAGDMYLVDTVTDRGAELAQDLTLVAVDEEHQRLAKDAQAAAEAALRPIETLVGIEDALEGLWDHEVWRDIAATCLACGTCTYLCPTCHCFAVEDRTLAGGGERVRAWDSCMYAGFTMHASGHNPRPDQGARWRQRVMHKFSYLPQNVAAYGCVGCGRCVINCPVNLDIRRVLARVREVSRMEAEESAS